MGLSSSRCAAREQETSCQKEEEGPVSKASELCIAGSSSNVARTPVGKQCSSTDDSSTKKGLLESLQQIKPETLGPAEIEERRMHQPPRILSRTRIYQVNAYSLTRLQRETHDEPGRGQYSIEEVQERLRSYSGSAPPPNIVDVDSSSYMGTSCSIHQERPDSTLMAKTHHFTSVDLTGRLSSRTEGTEGSHSFHEVDGYSHREPSNNRQYTQNVASRHSHYAGLQYAATNGGESTQRGNRRSSGRRFWDALTCTASQRRVNNYHESIGYGLVPSNDRPAVLNRRFGAIAVHDEERGGHMPYRNRSLNLDERRHRFRSQVWALQRLSTSFEGVPGHLRPCARRVRHDSADQSRATTQSTEETDTRESISRIIMLAEALFQVLDEIQQQSIVLSQSAGMPLGLLRAPHTIVDSMPIKVFQKGNSIENKEEAPSQCHICLVDYEGGDYLRVLPCSHEYHMICIDKWLREVHRVCPLCRRDVCEAMAVEK